MTNRYENLGNAAMADTPEELTELMHKLGGKDGMLLVTITKLAEGHHVHARLCCEDKDVARAGIVSLIVEHACALSGDMDERATELVNLMRSVMYAINLRETPVPH